MAPPTKAGVNQKLVNRITARIIPTCLAAIVGYVTYIVIVVVCVDYFLRPPVLLHKPRNRTAVAVIVIYTFLLFFMSISYLRLISTVILNPGYVLRGPQYYERSEKSGKRKTLGWGKERSRDPASVEKPGQVVRDSNWDGSSLQGFAYGSDSTKSGTPTTRPLPADDASPDLREFFGKEVFTCEGNGKPIWCSYCLNWKPDRAHHCREVGRCVRKMDHFCPWVGGVISETSFKFFLQFVAWTAIYCIFVLIIMGVVISELKKKTNHHHIVTITFAAFFAPFTIGLTGSSLQFVILNTTTIENLSRRNKVWQLAIYIPRPLASPPFPIISYPLVSPSSPSQNPNPQPRTFAILHSKPGENPWDLGAFANFKSVMGERWYEWFIPLTHSPCCQHDRGESQFALGPVVQRMRVEAGLAPAPSREEGIESPKGEKGVDGFARRKRRRRSRREEGSRTKRVRSEDDGSWVGEGESGGSSNGGGGKGIVLTERNGVVR